VVSSLASTSWGSGPLLVVCHGFTQNAAAWGPFGTFLGEHRTVVAVDLPGHGGSSHVTGTLEEAAEDILDLMGADPFDLVGYSMGGRVGLTMALRHPPTLRRLVMIGATAGLTSAGQRADRRAADERLALKLEDEGLERFLTWWLDQPLFSSLDAEDSARDARMTNDAAGLAASLRTMGTGTQEPSWGRLHEIKVPTLFVAGARDHRFCAVGRRMMAAVPDGSLVVVSGTGHACHLEAPSTTSRAIESWLASTDH